MTLARCVTLIPIALVAFALTVTTQTVSSSSAAQTPSGKSPADALEVTCNWEYLLPAGDVWYRLPRRGRRLWRISLVSYPEILEAMEFQV